MRQTVVWIMVLLGWLALAALSGFLFLAYRAPRTAGACLWSAADRLGLPLTSAVTAAPSVGSAGTLVLAGLTCFVAVFLLLFVFWGERRPAIPIRFRTSEGEVTVEISAVEECLRVMLEEDPEVSHATVTLRARTAATGQQVVDCVTRVALLEGPARPAKIESAIQRAVRERFEEIFPGVAQVQVQPHIVLRPAGEQTGIWRTPAPSALAEAESEPEVSGFRGLPTYPVDEPEAEPGKAGAGDLGGAEKPLGEGGQAL